MTQLLELLDRKLKLTMINIIRDLTEKNRKYERITVLQKEREKYLRKTSKENTRLQRYYNRNEECLKGIISRLDTLKRKSVSLRKGQQRLPNWYAKGKRELK